jgi:N-glycosidase YbiA
MCIYFYKVNDPYGCFSNFSPHGIEFDGICWLTVEHYYQAQKFVGTPDASIIPHIQEAETADCAAQLGRDFKSRKPRPDWDQVKLAVMKRAVRTKFLTHLDIQATLLSTGDAVIIEDSPIDYFWGCGQDQTGLNHLGQILMQVRAEIRYQTGADPR